MRRIQTLGTNTILRNVNSNKNNKEENSMKKNDIFELEITDMGTDGEGIGHYDGMTFFVKDALIGDVITARAVCQSYFHIRSPV